MQTQAAPKSVRIIPPKPEFSGENRIDIRPKRVAAKIGIKIFTKQP